MSSLPAVGTETHGVKYIGSKRKILPYIGDAIQGLGIGTAIDVFTGTTRVAQYLRQIGIRTTTSDLSWASTCYALTYVHNGDNSHLGEAVAAMNSLPPVHGWLSANYTGGVPQDAAAGDGRCFQLKNAMRADAARDWIEQQGCLRPWEKATLVTSVINALDSVDNTVGVQQAYLKNWCARSHNDIVFRLPACIAGPSDVHLEGDCLSLDYPPADLAYLDPPYSPHSYASYYHIWDSVARWDKPATALKAKRRVDRVARHENYDASMESPWNRRAGAMAAFETLVGTLPVRFVLVSYSDESLVPPSELEALCARHGRTKVLLVQHGRNIMSQIGNALRDGRSAVGNQKNTEMLILIDKSADAQAPA